jgi:hypothetical protein
MHQIRAHGAKSVLELRFGSRPWLADPDWQVATVVRCTLRWSTRGLVLSGPDMDEARIQSPEDLFGRLHGFDVLVLHDSLDHFVAGLPWFRRVKQARRWLARAVVALNAGGWMIGFGKNGALLAELIRQARGRTDASRLHGAFSATACAAELKAAGLVDAQAFSVLPSLDEARRLISVRAAASRRAYSIMIGSEHAGQSPARKVVALLFANMAIHRFAEPDYLFWARRPCSS